ncbi:MAG TPA: HEAT repeat domain-containing protein [Cyclobacteriaceae bacterium]|nr:HEAT repeat domain-containing protein [Cyclobacteriaceae bacterium]
MERERLEGLLIDFIDGRLTEPERKEVKELLNSDPDVMVLYEQLKQVTTVMDRSSEIKPSNKLYSGFQQMLKEESARENAPKQRQIFFTPAVFRAAAALLLVMTGVAIGYYVNQYNVQQQRLAQIVEENRLLREDMLAQMGDQSSASQRMKGVNVALTYSETERDMDTEVVSTLVKMLNEDKNTNVRLAALDALSKFQREPAVRKELITSLSKQDDPIVQIALIQLMVKMKEKGVLKDLNRIIEDNDAIKPVKDEAYSGILKLS